MALAGIVGLAGSARAAQMPALPVDCSGSVGAEIHDTAAAHFKDGEAAILAERWPEAEAALVKAVELDPLLAIARYGLGQTYMAQQRFQEAVLAFSTSRDAFRCAFPTSAKERRRREEEIRDLRAALRNFDERRLQELSAKWTRVNGDATSPGDRMRSAHDIERRIAELEDSLKDLDPSPPGVTLALGTALFQTGKMDEAEVAFRAVLSRDPKSGDAHNNLALVCTLTGRLEEAEREIAAARKAGIPVNPKLTQELERRKREAAKDPGK